MKHLLFLLGMLCIGSSYGQIATKGDQARVEPRFTKGQKLRYQYTEGVKIDPTESQEKVDESFTSKFSLTVEKATESLVEVRMRFDELPGEGLYADATAGLAPVFRFDWTGALDADIANMDEVLEKFDKQISRLEKKHKGDEAALQRLAEIRSKHATSLGVGKMFADIMPAFSHYYEGFPFNRYQVDTLQGKNLLGGATRQVSKVGFLKGKNGNWLYDATLESVQEDLEKGLQESVHQMAQEELGDSAVLLEMTMPDMGKNSQSKRLVVEFLGDSGIVKTYLRVSDDHIFGQRIRRMRNLELLSR